MCSGCLTPVNVGGRGIRFWCRKSRSFETNTRAGENRNLLANIKATIDLLEEILSERSESTNLWPALLGSLSLRRSRCIRRNCPACQSGEQHQSYVLYGRANGRRVAVYVAEELVPEVQRSLDNGRALQDLLHRAAPRYIKALKRARAGAPKSDGG